MKRLDAERESIWLLDGLAKKTPRHHQNKHMPLPVNGDLNISSLFPPPLLSSATMQLSGRRVYSCGVRREAVKGGRCVDFLVLSGKSWEYEKLYLPGRVLLLATFHSAQHLLGEE